MLHNLLLLVGIVTFILRREIAFDPVQDALAISYPLQLTFGWEHSADYESVHWPAIHVVVNHVDQ